MKFGLISEVAMNERNAVGAGISGKSTIARKNDWRIHEMNEANNPEG